MAAANVVFRRVFTDHDNALQQGQVVGFWDPTTAVLFGHIINAFGTAQVALAGVKFTGTGPGSVHYLTAAYATLDLPDQNDSGGGVYGNPVPARHVAFCPISSTVAVLVSAVMEHSVDGPWAPTTGIRSFVYYHVMRRADASASTFTLSDGWLAATCWHYPGDTGEHDIDAPVVVGIAGTPSGAAAIGSRTSWPQPTDKANALGTIIVNTDNSIDVSWVSESLTHAGFGRAAGTASEAPLFFNGDLRLAGPDGVRNIGTPLHTAGGGRPQIIGPLGDDGGAVRLGWATFTGTTAQFNSYGVAGSPAYGANVSVPLTGVPIVAVDVMPGSTRLDFVQVTLTMSNAVQDDMETGSGAAYVYGAVVDFRRTPALRAGWTLIGTYAYGDLPQKVAAVIDDVTDTSITVGWTASEGGAGQGPNTYDVFASGVLLANTNALSYQYSPLPPGSSYTFQVVAVDPAGNRSEASEPISATTTTPDSGPDTTPPTTPTLAVGGGDAYSVLLHATGSSDNVALAGYHVFDVTGGGMHLIKGMDPGGVTTLDWHIESPVTHDPYWLLDSSEHDFVVQAYDLAGNLSGLSNVVHATLTAVAHPSETSASVTSLGTTSITLSIVESTELGGSGTVVIDVYRSGVLIDTIAGDADTFSDTFVLHSKPVYQVQARDGAGWTSSMSAGVPAWA